MTDEDNTRPKYLQWWKERTLMEKLLLIGVIVLIFIIIIISCTKYSRTFSEKSTVCTTTKCFETSVKVVGEVDLEADPCKDFYNFACGRYINNTVLQKTRSAVSFFTTMTDKVDGRLRSVLEKPIQNNESRSSTLAKTFYQACMNTTEINAHSIATLKSIIKTMGGWPVLEGDQWDENSTDWIRTMYKVREQGLNPKMFFHFGLTLGSVRTPKTLSLSQPIIEYGSEFTNLYYDYMIKIVVALGAEETTARTQMQDVLYLEHNISEITLSLESKRSLLTGHPTKIRKLEEDYPYVPWLEFINIMLKPVSKVMTYDHYVTVVYPDYFKNLETVLKKFSQRTLINYIYWKSVKILTAFLSDDIRKIMLEFSTHISGISESEPRWKECTHMVTKFTDAAAGALYVKHFFKRETKQKVAEIVYDVRDQMVEDLKTIDWMDATTRAEALEKAEFIRIQVGYPEELLDDSKVDEIYKNLRMDSSKYLESVLNVSSFNFNAYYGQVGKTKNLLSWRRYSAATITNTYYAADVNSIWIPAGILHDVFYDDCRPSYMNYGTFGSLVGHEITHGFDDKGRNYDVNGNLVNWWQPEAKSYFQKKAQCIIDQYGNITVPEIGKKINGKSSRNENIADNGGIKLAYLAYQKWVKRNGPEQTLPGLPYTPEQMFWISWGNAWCEIQSKQQTEYSVTVETHLPHKYRINVPLMNSEFFARDFKCPLGSPMNPVEKCTVW